MAVGGDLGNLTQREVGASRALPFPRQFKTIWGNLGEFKTMGSRPIAGVAFPSGNLRQFKTIKTIYEAI